MNNNSDLKSIFEAQEKALRERLKELEAKEKNLEKNKNENQIELEQVKYEIVKTYEDISKVFGSKMELEQMNKEAKPERDKAHWETIMLGVDVVNSYLTGGISKDAQEQMLKMQLAQQQPRIEQQITNEKVVVSNVSSETKPFAEVNELFKNALEIEHTENIKALQDSRTTTNDEKQKELPDAAEKWKLDIANKENELKNSHQKQLDALEKNKILLEIQKQDAKKFPDAEKKLEQLKPMDELMKREEENINSKLKDGMEEIRKEREAMENKIKREEFERQKIELEERNRNR